MMPELHKIKLHSQEARNSRGSRDEDEDEGAYWIKQCPFHISKAHVPHSKGAGGCVCVTTCHSLCASVCVCVCVARAICMQHCELCCQHTRWTIAPQVHWGCDVNTRLSFSLSLSLSVCPSPSGHLLSVVLTMLKTSSPNSATYDLRDLCALCNQSCSSSSICTSHTSIPF